MLTQKYNTKIEFWTDIDSVDEVGAPIKTFAKFKEDYAFKKQIGGNSKYDEIGIIPEWQMAFTIRWDSHIKYGIKIKYNDEFYNIENIEVIGRNIELKITAAVYKSDD